MLTPRTLYNGTTTLSSTAVRSAYKCSTTVAITPANYIDRYRTFIAANFPPYRADSLSVLVGVGSIVPSALALPQFHVVPPVPLWSLLHTQPAALGHRQPPEVVSDSLHLFTPWPDWAWVACGICDEESSLYTHSVGSDRPYPGPSLPRVLPIIFLKTYFFIPLTDHTPYCILLLR